VPGAVEPLEIAVAVVFIEDVDVVHSRVEADVSTVVLATEVDAASTTERGEAVSSASCAQTRDHAKR
jgi:hypothetical protein